MTYMYMHIGEVLKYFTKVHVSLRSGSEYLALRPEVNVNVWPNARIELGSILKIF